MYIYVLRVASGPRVRLASCKSALNSPVVCSTDRSKAVVPVLVLLLCGLFYEAICCVSFRVSCCSCVFRSFWYCGCLALVGVGGGAVELRGAGLDAFRTFVRFVLD